MSNAPRAWVTISGQDANGTAVGVIGQEALRTVYFDPDAFRITLDTATTPPRVMISSPALDTVARDLAALTIRVAALEAQLAAATSAATPGTLMKRDGSGNVNAAAFKGNVQEASAGVKLKILASDGQEVARFGLNGSNPALRFFDGGTMALQQNVPAIAPTADEVASVVTQLGLAVGV